MGKNAWRLCPGFLFFSVAVVVSGVKGINIWPMPKSVSHGDQTLFIKKDFGLRTDKSKYVDASGILKDGFSRLLDVMEASHVIDNNSNYYNDSMLLQGLHVIILSPTDELQYAVDESYRLFIPSSGKPEFVHLEAQTIYGALHGMQTFSQLCYFNFKTRTVEVHMAPWNIFDEPRFPFRGLLIDTSRHYLPLPMIRNVIDAMSFTKLNVLHWHIVDTQSFPLEIPSYPKLWDGAYSISERYTIADAAKIVNYAQRRGINVLAEIDVPGHALSWGIVLTMPYIDSVSWNAMIAAFGQHGYGADAIGMFEQMLREGIYPDRITFITVLSACSHTGLIREGCHYFKSMYNTYGISPGEDHYAHFIDLLCRAGRFSEAKDVIKTMPFEPGSPIWEALLAGCRIHGNMELGIQAAERLFELMPQHDGTYILLSNMYANVGRWDDVAKVRKAMRDRGVKKEPGCSWIEVEKKVHVFLVDDTLHPYVQEVYKYLDQLGVKMRKLGYVPDTKFVLHDVESEQKEYVLSTHSEKLAVGFGLLKLPNGATIRVLKNLRICGDCHKAFMFMSKVTDREIVVRDGKRFHHFRNGDCSCGNYW